MGAGKRKGTGNADGANAVELIGIVEAFRLRRDRGDRLVAKAMGGDTVDHIGDTAGIEAAVPQQFARIGGSREVVAGTPGDILTVPSGQQLWLKRSRHVMEQGGQTDNFDIRIFGGSDVYGQMCHAEDVVKVMCRIVSGIVAWPRPHIEVASLAVSQVSGCVHANYTDKKSDTKNTSL
jgi:hypothetical protein